MKIKEYLYPAFLLFLICAYCFSGSEETSKINDERLKAKAQIPLKQLESNNDAIKRRAFNELVNMGRDIIPFLKECLNNPSANGRIEIPLILSEIGDQSSITDLLRIATGEGSNEQIRQNTVIALKNFKNPQSVDGLIKILGNVGISEKTKELVLDALVAITTHNLGRDENKWQLWWDKNKNNIIRGSTELIALSDIPTFLPEDKELSSILSKMTNTSSEIRIQGMKEFLESKNPEKAKILFQIIILAKDPLENVRYSAIRTFAELKNPAGIIVLSNLALDSSDIRTKQEAVTALANIADIKGVPAIIILSEKNKEISLNYTLIDSLYSLNDTIPESEIALNLTSWNTYIQKFCVKTIANKGMRQYIKNLEEIAKSDDDNEVRTESIKSIGILRAISSTPVLMELLETEENAIIKSLIISILPSITNEDKGIQPEIWINWWKENKANFLNQIMHYESNKELEKSKDKQLYSRIWHERFSRIKEIEKTQNGNLIDSLIPFMDKEPVWICRNSAIRAVSGYYIKDKVLLFNRLKSFNTEERNNARKILTLCGDIFIKDIVGYLKSDNYMIKKQCSEILGDIRNNQAIDPLINEIKENKYKGIIPSPFAKALSNYSSEAVNKLIPLLTSDNEDNSDDAFWALAGINKRYLIPTIPHIIPKLKNKDVFIKEQACKLLNQVVGERFRICRDAEEWKNKKIKKYPDFTNYKPDDALSMTLLREQKEILNLQITNLTSQDIYAFDKAKKYLTENADQESLATLFEMYKTEDPRIKETIIDCLLAAPDLSYQLILSNLNAEIQANQECAILTADRWKNKKDFIIADKIIQKCLISDNKRIKLAAVSLLSEFKLGENNEIFIKLLKDPDYNIKSLAARGLAALYSVNSINEIKNQIDNIVDLQNKLKLAESAAILGDASVSIHFQKILSPPNYDIIKNSIYLFPPVLSSSFEELIIAAIPNAPKEILKDLILFLGYIGGSKSADFLENFKSNCESNISKYIEISNNMIKTNEIIF